MKSTNLEFQKKTFNIEIDNIRDMQEFIPSRKQTEFVNKIIREKFNEIKQQQSLWNWLISPLFGCKTQLFFLSTASTSALKVAFFAQKLKKLSRAQSFVVGSSLLCAFLSAHHSRVTTSLSH